jgi:drug/metabolite transporter (DMT)-like permease
MRLFLLTAFTMLAFASNSILTRMAIEPGFIDPFGFALIRVLAGAAFLAALVSRRGMPLPLWGLRRVVGAGSLAVYMVGFSLAYVTLDAGLGALILFGTVQISMFAYAASRDVRPSPRQLVGAAIAFAGLVIALRPEDGGQASLAGSLAMVCAGLGWAAYTLSGKAARNPLAETAGNFVLCFPLLLIATGFMVEVPTLAGVLLAVLCGAVTSGLGYALWYLVLPELQRNVAAVVQLSVPILAILAGAAVLGERVTLPVLIAAACVVAGIGLAVTKRSAPADRS